MKRLRQKFKHIPSPLPILFILIGTIAVVLYGRGYRPNIEETNLKSTGLISVSSDPTGAQVLVDNVVRTATKDTVTVEPGWYDVKVIKEGYIAWAKKLRVQGEVVTSIDPFLFPKNPSLSPLTNLGIENAIVSPDNSRIAYITPISEDTPEEKAGLWVHDLSDRAFGFNRDARQVGITSELFNFSQSTILWSPDSSQIMTDNGTMVRLYNVNRTGDFETVTNVYKEILDEWEEEHQIRKQQQLEAFEKPFRDFVNNNAQIIAFSPNETKILYEATNSATLDQVITPPLIGTNPTEESRTIEPQKYYVYDSREDKNFFAFDKTETPMAETTSVAPLPEDDDSTANILESEIKPVPPLHWFPTSRHLVLTLEGKLDIMEYDRTNWVTVYSGPFEDGFIAPFPNGSRIIITTNLNPGASELPNLYTVNLR